MPNIFMILEAINSVALSHNDNCGCTTCKAAHGDKEALANLLMEINKRTDK